MLVICCYRCDYHVVAVFADLIKITDYSHPVTTAWDPTVFTR